MAQKNDQLFRIEVLPIAIEMVRTKWYKRSGTNEVVRRSGTDEVVRTKWYTDEEVADEVARTKWHKRSGTDEIARTKWYGRSGHGRRGIDLLTFFGTA